MKQSASRHATAVMVRTASAFIEVSAMKLMHISLFAIVALSLNAAADEPKVSAQPARTVFERHDQSGVIKHADILSLV